MLCVLTALSKYFCRFPDTPSVEGRNKRERSRFRGKPGRPSLRFLAKVVFRRHEGNLALLTALRLGEDFENDIVKLCIGREMELLKNSCPSPAERRIAAFPGRSPPSNDAAGPFAGCIEANSVPWKCRSDGRRETKIRRWRLQRWV